MSKPFSTSFLTAIRAHFPVFGDLIAAKNSMSDLTPEQLQAILTPEYRAADNGSRSILLTCYIMLAINTFFLVLFFVSRYFNEAAIRTPMLILIPIGWVFGTLVEIIGLRMSLKRLLDVR